MSVIVAAVVLVAAMNRKLVMGLAKAKEMDPAARPFAMRSLWQWHDSMPTRYAKRPQVSQQKRRKLERRVVAHGWRKAA